MTPAAASASQVEVDPDFRRAFQDRVVRWYRRAGRGLPSGARARCPRCPLRRTCRAAAGGPPAAVWREHGAAMAAERTVGYRVGATRPVRPPPPANEPSLD